MTKHIPLPDKETRIKAVRQLIDKGIEPSPENLLKANRRKGTPLYEYFRGIDEKTWAEFGRYETARRIIDNVPQVHFVGGVQIETRMVEVVRDKGEKRWAAMDDILSSSALRDSYMSEVQRLMEQAQAKLENLRALMKDDAA